MGVQIGVHAFLARGGVHTTSTLPENERQQHALLSSQHALVLYTHSLFAKVPLTRGKTKKKETKVKYNAESGTLVVAPNVRAALNAKNDGKKRQR